MKFKTQRACSAYVDTVNKLKLDVEAVFIRYERKVRCSGGEKATVGLLKELERLDSVCASQIREGLRRFREEWDV